MWLLITASLSQFGDTIRKQVLTRFIPSKCGQWRTPWKKDGPMLFRKHSVTHPCVLPAVQVASTVSVESRNASFAIRASVFI